MTGNIKDGSVNECQLSHASTMQVPTWDAAFINSKCSFPAMTYTQNAFYEKVYQFSLNMSFKLTSAEVLTPALSRDHSVIQRVKITNRSET